MNSYSFSFSTISWVMNYFYSSVYLNPWAAGKLNVPQHFEFRCLYTLNNNSQSVNNSTRSSHLIDLCYCSLVTFMLSQLCFMWFIFSYTWCIRERYAMVKKSILRFWWICTFCASLNTKKWVLAWYVCMYGCTCTSRVCEQLNRFYSYSVFKGVSKKLGTSDGLQNKRWFSWKWL
jgi:hypothetical protein